MYLVLIKSKSDELRKIQPLQSFPPICETSNQKSLEQMPSLQPKELIKQYQLEKSQLAFTYCTLGPDGQSFMPDWTTTILSSILTGKKSANLSLSLFLIEYLAERSTEYSKKRKLTCPECSHVFQITLDETDDVSPKKVLKKHKHS